MSKKSTTAVNALSLESLKEQLKSVEAEQEGAKAHLYRTDGVIQLLKHQITSLETPAKPAEDAVAPTEA